MLSSVISFGVLVSLCISVNASFGVAVTPRIVLWVVIGSGAVSVSVSVSGGRDSCGENERVGRDFGGDDVVLYGLLPALGFREICLVGRLIDPRAYCMRAGLADSTRRIDGDIWWYCGLLEGWCYNC